MNLPKTRAEAKSLNSIHYFTGIPCKYGHIASRFTSIGKCKTCAARESMSNYSHTTNKRRAYTDISGLITKAIAVHGDSYTYLNSVYINAHTRLNVTCKLHGDFGVSPTNLVQGKGCPICGNKRSQIKQTKSIQTFINEAKVVWGDLFDYSDVVYLGAKKAVSLKCNTHNEIFTQTPGEHLSGKNPCTKCNHMKSSQEDYIANFLSKFTTVIRRDRTVISPKELDIYMPELNLAIEYCGMYWHSSFNAEDEAKFKTKHIDKYRLAAKAGVRVITIYEHEWLTRRKQILRLLRNAINASKGRVFARKCTVVKVAHTEAVKFFEGYHPQGGAGSGTNFGLYWKGKLVSCMRFTLGVNDRGSNTNRVWTLSRYASRVTVVGGASRLFKAFVSEYDPSTVKSFSDNRYFAGGMYAQLGYEMESESDADYSVWSQKTNTLKPKSNYQRRTLAARQKDQGVDVDFIAKTDPRTEKEVTYAMGCGRIYDCGKKKWVWNKPLQKTLN